VGGLFRTLLVVWFITKFWWCILLVLAAICVGLALWLGHQRRLEPAGRRRREEVALAARADQQHAWILAGGDCGVYGDYTPNQLD
jgi:nitrate/nitrite transporter NarK